MSEGIKVTDTIISSPGVLRCCLAFLCEEELERGVLVREGDKASCRACKRAFTLRKRMKGPMIWFPDDFTFNPEDC